MISRGRVIEEHSMFDLVIGTGERPDPIAFT